jgi:hypothetical protein
MDDQWNEKLRCPRCNHTGVVGLSQPKGAYIPVVDIMPDGFKGRKIRIRYQLRMRIMQSRSSSVRAPQLAASFTSRSAEQKPRSTSPPRSPHQPDERDHGEGQHENHIRQAPAAQSGTDHRHSPDGLIASLSVGRAPPSAVGDSDHHPWQGLLESERRGTERM